MYVIWESCTLGNGQLGASGQVLGMIWRIIGLRKTSEVVRVDFSLLLFSFCTGIGFYLGFSGWSCRGMVKELKKLMCCWYCKALWVGVGGFW